jgi:tetratricopeptide (TPR) repeat protein
MPAPRQKITVTLSEPQGALAPVADIEQALREAVADLQQGRRARAAKLLRRVLAQAPQHAEALRLKGLIALQENLHAKAEAALAEALALEPAHAVAWSNLGLAVAGQRRHDEALRHYERALALAPDFADAHGNRGLSLNALRRFDEALAAYDRAIALAPGHGDAWRNRGVCLNNLNRYDDAVASYDRAETLQPEDAAARWNRCLVRLITGDFAAAWPDYRWRWRVRQSRADPARPPFWLGDRTTAVRRLPQDVPCSYTPPFWDGGRTDRSLLVWPEQGVGEQIMFASILAEARARVGAMTLALDPKLQPLFRRAFPDCRVIGVEEAGRGDGWDYQLPMGDLLNLFRRGSADFLRRRRAYLHADAQRRAALRREIAPAGRRVIGLSWFSRNEEFGPQKTLSPAALGPLFALPGLRFVDLQYGDTSQARADIERHFGVVLHRPASVDPWRDLDGLAALADACDVVVTISTAVAHLAGALGKTVLLMLPYSQGRYWYWQATREDSLWYPDVRIFRQHKAGDWSDVVTRVRAALAGEEPRAPRH